MRTSILKFRTIALQHSRSLRLPNISRIRGSSHIRGLPEQSSLLGSRMGLSLWTGMVLDSPGNTTPLGSNLDPSSGRVGYSGYDLSLLVRLENRHGLYDEQHDRLRGPVQYADSLADTVRPSQLEASLGPSHSQTTSRWTRARMEVHLRLVTATALCVCVLCTLVYALADSTVQRQDNRRLSHGS